jgi:hypothetical protein
MMEDLVADDWSSNRFNCSGGNFYLNCVVLNEKLKNVLQALK